MARYRGRHHRGRTNRLLWVFMALVTAVGCLVFAWPSTGTPTTSAAAPSPVSTFSSAEVPPPAEPLPTSTAPITQRDWIELPALGISAHLVPEAVDAQQLTIPPAAEVGWWIGGAAPDARATSGTTLLAAHVNLDGEEGAFAPLYRAEYGDRIYLTDSQGRRSAWAVVAVATVAKADVPQSIFTATGRRRLVLVTCTGKLIATRGHGHSYDSNLIVTALPINPRSTG